MRIRLEFKPQDCWIGLYFRTEEIGGWHFGDDGGIVMPTQIDVWLCLLPLLPVHLTWTRGVRETRREG